MDSFVIFTLFHIKMFFYTAILQHLQFCIEYIHKSDRIIHKFTWSFQPQLILMSLNDVIKKMKQFPSVINRSLQLKAIVCSLLMVRCPLCFAVIFF